MAAWLFEKLHVDRYGDSREKSPLTPSHIVWRALTLTLKSGMLQDQSDCWYCRSYSIYVRGTSHQELHLSTCHNFDFTKFTFERGAIPTTINILGSTIWILYDTWIKLDIPDKANLLPYCIPYDNYLIYFPLPILYYPFLHSHLMSSLSCSLYMLTIPPCCPSWCLWRSCFRLVL